tara:strand:+ start:15 stop:131 length:117 start_codon:yes stop_codon:yes gene_type:complete
MPLKLLRFIETVGFNASNSFKKIDDSGTKAKSFTSKVA